MAFTQFPVARLLQVPPRSLALFQSQRTHFTRALRAANTFNTHQQHSKTPCTHTRSCVCKTPCTYTHSQTRGYARDSRRSVQAELPPIMKMPIDDGKADTYVVGSRGDAIVVTAQHRDDIQAALAFNAQARQVLSQYKNDPSLKESREMTGTKEWKNTIRRVIDGQGVRAFAGDKRLAEVRKACIIEMAQTDIGEAFSQRFDKTVTDFLAKNAQAQFLHSSKTTTAVEFVKKYIAARDAGNEEKKKPGKGSKSKAAQKENDRREWLQVFHEIRGLYDDFDRMDALDCSPLFKTWTPHDKVLLLNDYELFQAKDEESLKDQMKLASRLEVYYNLDNNVPSGSWFTAKAAHQEQVEFVRQLLEDPHKLQRWFIAAPDADVVLAMRVFFANRRAVLDQLDIAF